MPATPEAVWRARELVMAALIDAGCTAESIEVARLLTSELATNSVVHARSATVTVEVVVHEPRFRVTVHDEDPVAPREPSAVPDEATSGRGLLLVQSLAERWATEVCRDPDGKVVWFEMACA